MASSKIKSHKIHLFQLTSKIVWHRKKILFRIHITRFQNEEVGLFLSWQISVANISSLTVFNDVVGKWLAAFNYYYLSRKKSFLLYIFFIRENRECQKWFWRTYLIRRNYYQCGCVVSQGWNSSTLSISYSLKTLFCICKPLGQIYFFIFNTHML